MAECFDDDLSQRPVPRVRVCRTVDPMKSARVIFSAVVVAALLLPATASAADFPLRGWWPLNEGKGQTVRDWSGNRNHGYLGSTPQADANDPAWTKGIFFGSALNFGGDDYVTIADSPTLEPQTLTVSAWVKAPTSPGPFTYIVAKGARDCTAASYALHTSWHGGIQFYVWNGSAQLNSAWRDASIWNGKWHHVAGTYDGRLTKLFVDGKDMGEGSSAADPIDYETEPNGNGTIGAYLGTCDLMFTGDIDEVHVWSQALPVDSIWARWKWLLGIPGRM
jgi:hypothetical protein